MTTPQLPSGLAHGLPFTVPADWTAEQALAVCEWLSKTAYIWRNS